MVRDDEDMEELDDRMDSDRHEEKISNMYSSKISRLSRKFLGGFRDG